MSDPLASLSAPIAALLAALIVGVTAAALVYWRSRRVSTATQAADLQAKGIDSLEGYPLILATLDRSNVLIWWGRVTREGSGYNWNIKTPPQLSDNPIYRLAACGDKGLLRTKEQSPDFEDMRRTARKAFAEGASGYQQVFRIQGADSMHWLSEEVVIRPAGPDEWNLAGVVVDVTKRHEAEEARKAAQGQMEEILRSADCLLWQATVTGDPDVELKWDSYAVPSALYKRIFGREAATPQAMGWKEGEKMVPEFAEIEANSRRALREGKPGYEQEFHVVTPDYTFCVREHVTITRIGPGKWNLVGVIVDITERREAEQAFAAEKERLAVTLGSMSEGVITVDQHGHVLFINRAAAGLTQWDESEAVGRELSEVCVLQNASSPGAAVLPLDEVLGGAVRAELPPQTLLKGRSEGVRQVEGRLVPVADRTSKRVGAVLVLRDVTDNNRMEDKLQHAAKMESVGLLAGGIAHDFNNILTVILSNLTLLQLDVTGMPEEARLLDEAVRATKRASELTHQLLTFSKGGDPVRTAVHLNEVIQETANFARRGSGVKCEFDVPFDLWAANVDRAQISQVIQNLVINAIQAMPGGGLLRISAKNEPLASGAHPALAPGDFVRVSVADTGAGIAPENIGKIFDPYFTTKLLGHGLGLATVFSIIKRHQGHIEVSSVIGTGSTFTFWLPAAFASGSEKARPEMFAIAGRGGRVLFMDDEEPILNMAGKLMQRMGLEFESAADGEKAIELYRAAKDAGRPFDLVVMDLTIPGGMGGKEAIAILRQIDPGVRAIVSSGYSSDLAMSEFRQHGFLGMVAKPYDIKELASVVRSVLGEPAQVAGS